MALVFVGWCVQRISMTRRAMHELMHRRVPDSIVCVYLCVESLACHGQRALGGVRWGGEGPYLGIWVGGMGVWGSWSAAVMASWLDSRWWCEHLRLDSLVLFDVFSCTFFLNYFNKIFLSALEHGEVPIKSLLSKEPLFPMYLFLETISIFSRFGSVAENHKL